MYEEAKTCVRTPVGNAKYFPAEVGLHKGSSISPYLFALILDELSRGMQESITWCLIFADHILLVPVMMEGLNSKLEQWREPLEDNGLRVSIKKTKYLWCDFDRNMKDRSEEEEI